MPKRTASTHIQQPLPFEIIVVPKRDMKDAWEWLIQCISPRPREPSGPCIFDRKLWKNRREREPLKPDCSVLKVLGDLFLASQLGDLTAIINMVNGGNSSDIAIYDGQLDRDTKNIICNRTRFRNALSEHLSFWTRLATAAQSRTHKRTLRFAHTMPNFQPEDKGPDGIFVDAGATMLVEIQSVKSSINNPVPKISSSSFRKRGRAKKGKQLDDFWFKAKKSLGLGRLDRLLSQALAPLNLTVVQKERMGLLLDCTYNAVVVADDKYADKDIFNGYQFVTEEVEKRIATYIGATSWKRVAEDVRRSVRQTLGAAGVR